MTQRDLAARTGLGINTISANENGKNFPPLSTRKAYAKAFGFDDVVLFDDGWRRDPPEARRTSRGSPRGDIPVINQAPAGQPRSYDECFSDSGLGFEYILRTPGLPEGDLFAFVVVGDSMVPEFQPGDYVVCQWAELADIEEGEAAFFRFGNMRPDGCTFKRLFPSRDGRVELRPDNLRHPHLLVDPADILRVGGVVEVRRMTRRARKTRRYEDSESQIEQPRNED